MNINEHGFVELKINCPGITYTVGWCCSDIPFGLLNTELNISN